MYKFRHALGLRTHLLNDPDETCIRLFTGDYQDEEALTIDLYGEYLLIQNFTSENFIDEESFLDHYLDILSSEGVTVKGVLVKDRRKTGDYKNLMDVRKSRLARGSVPPEGYTVRHAGCSFFVDLVNSQHTGLFADMRNARKRLSSFYEPSMRMLNLFSYTGAFSVHALKKGISSAVNVDLSKAILSRARENYLLNGLQCDNRDFFHEDSSAALKYFLKKDRRFNIIIFDPPTFSRNKKGVFSVEKDYPLFLDRIHDLLDENGLLFSCINAFSVTKDKYLELHDSGWQPVFFEKESEDFESGSGNYLKCGLWRKTSRKS